MLQFRGTNDKAFLIHPDDKAAVKFAMLIEGHLYGAKDACIKYGYTEQRYYQLLKKYNSMGLEGLINKKRGSEKQPVRTELVTNQIIRLRFLDPFSSAAVISQKLKQQGYEVSTRSVERTITEYGLQKKRMSLTPQKKKKVKRLKP
jgi:transposase